MKNTMKETYTLDYLTNEAYQGFNIKSTNLGVTVERIFRRYLEDVRKIKILNLDIPLDKTMIDRFPYIFMVESAYRKCSLDTQEYLYREYIDKKKNKWYLGEISAATYYRRRSYAIEEFLTYLL